jgi:hypothetical protein
VIDLPVQPQGEAITWTSDGRALLIASERDDRLIRVEVPNEPTAVVATEEPQTNSTELPQEATSDSPWILAVFLGLGALGFLGLTEVLRRRSQRALAGESK